VTPRALVSATKPFVFAAALAPFAFIALQIWRAWRGEPNDLGANPIKEAEIRTGVWALRFLAVTLALTPLRRLTSWQWLVRYRRMMGLFTFFYATAHLIIFFVIDIELDWADLMKGITDRPYITVGMTTWLLLVPLAVTSTKGWIRRLGGQRWNRLHRLIYLIPVGGTVHYLWSVKKDLRPPLLYALLFAVLLGTRLWLRYRGSSTSATRRVSSSSENGFWRKETRPSGSPARPIASSE
jgi:methionine sulfoxide reductase heme-binding subunit